MFKRFDYIPDHFGDYHFPDSLIEDIRNKQYTNAAESMIRHNIPFNYAFIFLSNSPEALSCYLFNSIPELDDADFNADDDTKEGEEEEDKKDGGASEKADAGGDSANADADAGAAASESVDPTAPSADGDTPAQKKKDDSPKKSISPRSALLMNLYVAVTIPVIQTKIGKERKVESDKMVDFCKKCKIALDKHHIYKVLRECSDDDLAKSIYLLFGDIWEYSMIMFEKKQYDKIFVELTKLEEQPRAQVIRRFPEDYHDAMARQWLEGELPNGPSLLPFLIELTFAKSYNEPMVANLKKVLLKMYNRRGLTTPPQIQIFYHLVYLTMKNEENKVEKDTDDKKTGIIYDIYARKDNLLNIGYDYILRHLERRGLFNFAAQLCAYEDTRHKEAVTYSIKKDIDCVYNILMIDLDDAPDNRECWMRALIRSKPNQDDPEMDQWMNRLLVTATQSSKVALDEVFPLMPKNMGIETFKPTILKTIKEAQANANASNARIDLLIKRSNKQRELIRIGPKLTANLDSIALCSICNQSIYTDRYLVFPCNHTVHVSCFLDSMHLYYDPIIRLNLISLSARAMRDEQRSTELADIICNSCPICGELSINVLSKGFTIKQEFGPGTDGDLWHLPKAFVKEGEEPEFDGEEEEAPQTKTQEFLNKTKEAFQKINIKLPGKE
ncbi:Vacuolar protein sorting-associated protein 18 like protein [Tritrichomonas musculus]|uniref:Vacuolar protein sorting-associated protein 18 like protein n=1 Tax=Tritrichomonas musculus TaxID=1915356 RepID=A0ABR2HW91_9EUKA